jgi:AcrR family transcriptional regulator
MPRISAEQEEATRSRLLRAARRVFVEKGIHEATTHDVAREAGLSVGSIYTYYRSKEELVRASILAANKAETDAVLADVRTAGSSREKMSRAVRGWYAYTIEAPGVPAFLAEMWASSSRKPLVRDLVARRRERLVTVAAIILREGISAGELAHDMDVDLTAHTIAALLDGLVLERIEAGDSMTLTETVRRVLLVLGPVEVSRSPARPAG